MDKTKTGKCFLDKTKTGKIAVIFVTNLCCLFGLFPCCFVFFCFFFAVSMGRGGGAGFFYLLFNIIFVSVC